MNWKLEISETALKQLKRLNASVKDKILQYLKDYLKRINDNSINPKEDLKPLLGNKQGLYRLRYRDYRVIVAIEEEEIKIIALSIGHRKDVYG